MAVTFNDTSDQVLHYLHNTRACLRSSVEEYFEKIYGKQSGINPLSSMGQLVIDDLIVEETDHQFHVTAAGEDILRKYGSYTAYKKSLEIKPVAESLPVQQDIPEEILGRKRIPTWVFVLLAIVIAAILVTALYHKG
jgi:hypothetical protein